MISKEEARRRLGAPELGPEGRARVRCLELQPLTLERRPSGNGYRIGFGRYFATSHGCPETCTMAEARAWFTDDWNRARAEALDLLRKFGVSEIDAVRLGVVVELRYVLRYAGAVKLTRFWGALKAGAYWTAADELLWSNPRDHLPKPTPWHRREPDRVRFLAAIMRLGADQPARE